ncbi:fungal specific transcription factor domain-containing protein [Colletotrichum graminicola]|uniref:Fungal specific transcription factor domain-containing protein n=1 Tax=Colletotrichum graminicola (strain M1.001 / M2 / FGSC 10212) TaxID=645133 RepID=E3QSI1_COLGM|nr:fungal specific transcription factor domain-containing protein [Colletotrichum graminicola M1.001]EFQ33808.1 fungal specific transcription factor domain-containing protein [Colletotrichum graminicola M1.001]WDK21084.1 fungal specific transcription factor domain-containing protein [Colletotrichum graminicola]
MDPSRSPDQSSTTRKKRRRPALACERCRHRKVRCDRNLPCNTCVRTGHTLCTYVSQTKPAARPLRSPGANGSTGHMAPARDSLSDPAHSAFRSLPPPRYSAPSMMMTQNDLAVRRKPGGPKSPVHGSAEPEAGFGIPDPILPTAQALRGLKDPESSALRLDLETSEGAPLFAPTPIPVEQPGPADHGKYRSDNPVRASASVSVLADTASTPGSCPSSSSTVNALTERVKQLEQQLSDLTVSGGSRSDGPSRSAPVLREGLKYSRGCVSKTRYFGQSHWMASTEMLYRMGNITRKFGGETTSQLYSDLEACKKLARVVKARRTPAFSSISIGKSMPSRELADILIGNYLRTFETVHRIVHVPTFKADYEQYWENPSEASEPFVVLMQLCMGIGATVYDERFTLRILATQWFWEGMFWLITPCEKSKMTITGIQIRCLMHFLRHTANIGCDLSWIGAGALVRTAMYMGFHREPKAIVKMTPYRAEMRRRLWVTVLEMALQTSIDSGGPPLISMHDYDTEPPANIDDEQLVEDADSAYPVPKDAKTYTQMTVPIALFGTFAARLATAKRVNDFRSDTVYEETLRYSNGLSSSLQRMMRQLQSHASVTAFQLRHVEVVSYRFFFALHQPIIPLALRNPMYYFSRMVMFDTALRLCESAFLCPDESGSGAAKPATPSEVDFQRLTINGAGTYRSVTLQSIMVIGLELCNLKEEELTNGPAMPFVGSEAQLRGIINTFHDWFRRRILSGETNVKGHLFSALLTSHISSMENGFDDERFGEYFRATCQERVAECSEMLRELAGDSAPDVPSVHDLDMDFDGVDLLGDWDWESMEDDGGIGYMNFGAVPDMLFP